jgi:hypothetical protein
MSLLFLTLLNLPKDQRAKALHRVLPVILPAPPATQVALAVLTAEQDVKREAAAEQQLVTEAVQAAGIKNASELAAFPALNTAFKKLSASVQTAILNPTPSAPLDDREVTLAPNPEAGTPASTRTRASSQPTVRP